MEQVAHRVEQMKKVQDELDRYMLPENYGEEKEQE